MHTPERDNLEQALSRLYKAEPPQSFEAGWRNAVRREEKISMMNTPKNSRRFWRVAAPVCAALVLVLGSLWAGNVQPGLKSPMPQSATDSLQANQAVTYRSSSANDMPATMSEEASYDAGMSMSSSSATAGLGAGASTEAAADDRKIVRTADVTLRTQTFDADAERLTALVEELGGYVEGLYQYGDTQSGGTRTLTVTLRVPQDSLDAFLSGVEGIGRVIDRSESSTDMTVQYADNEARLNTLRDKLTRLNELLLQAETVSDLVEIETAISDTQYEIDSYETAQRSIDRRVNMSAVYVTLQEETPAQSASDADVSLGERVGAAFAASLEWLGEFGRNLVVFLVAIAPVAVPVALVVVAVVILRARKKGSKEE